MESIPNISKKRQGVVPQNGTSFPKNARDFLQENEILADGAENCSSSSFSVPIAFTDRTPFSHVDDEIETEEQDEDYYANDLDDEVEDADEAKQQQFTDDGENGEVPLKFGYPEFDGEQGRYLLYKIIKQITSVAIYDTWQSCVSYQRPGNDCYVGTNRLYKDMSIKVSLVERSMRWRWQQMKEQGLVIFREKVVEVVWPDGSVHQEIRHIKDFSPLYDLAYQFYQWMRSSAYIPPCYENAAAIRQNKELAIWLAERFDCYRRVICNRKPGRKPQQRDRSECIKNQIEEAIARDETELKSFSNTFSNTFAVYNENEISNTNYQDKYTNGLASSTGLKEVGAAGAQAIGSTNRELNLSRNGGVTKNGDEQNFPTPTSETPKQETEMPAAAALVPVQSEKLVNVEKTARRELPSAWRELIQQMPARTPQKLIEQLVPHLMLWTNDQASEAYVRHSFVRFFKQSGNGIFDPEVVRLAMLLALVEAYALPPEAVTSHNLSDGSPNWMPKFWGALKKSLPNAIFLRQQQMLEPSAKVAETREEESCCEGTQNNEGTQDIPPDLEQLTAEQLLEIAPHYDILVDPEEQAKIEQHDEELTDTLRECIWQVMIEQETQQRYQDELKQVMKTLKPLMEPVTAIQTAPCLACGSHVSYRAEDGQCYCVVCVPSWRWSLGRRKQIKAAIQNMPNALMIQAEVEQDIPLPVPPGQK